jgi:hypothetical protein
MSTLQAPGARNTGSAPDMDSYRGFKGDCECVWGEVEWVRSSVLTEFYTLEVRISRDSDLTGFGSHGVRISRSLHLTEFGSHGVCISRRSDLTEFESHGVWVSRGAGLTECGSHGVRISRIVKFVYRWCCLSMVLFIDGVVYRLYRWWCLSMVLPLLGSLITVAIYLILADIFQQGDTFTVNSCDVNRVDEGCLTK